MAEQLRSVEVTITVDTNKRTTQKTLRPYPDEDTLDFIERIGEVLKVMKDVD